MKSVLCHGFILCSQNLSGALFLRMLKLNLPAYLDILKSPSSLMTNVIFTETWNLLFQTLQTPPLALECWWNFCEGGSVSKAAIVYFSKSVVHNWFFVTFDIILSIKKTSWIYTNGIFFIISFGISNVATTLKFILVPPLPSPLVCVRLTYLSLPSSFQRNGWPAHLQIGKKKKKV